MRPQLICFLILALLGSCNKTINYNQPNKEKLSIALDFLKRKSFQDANNEVIIIKDGQTIHEGINVGKKHNIYSCTKSLTSTILGLLVAEGKVNIDDYAWRYEPTLKEKYPELKLKHFATMTSGYSGKGISRWSAENSDWSWTPYDPDEPHFKPGSHYEYWDEAQMMYGRVLTNILNETMYSYLKRKVMDPIGLGEWEWITEGKTTNGIDINNGCTGIKINAKQMALIGELFLNKGSWKGKQIIPKSWVQAAVTNQVPAATPVYAGDRQSVKGSGSYGYNWWVNSKDGLSKMPESPLNVAYMSGLNHNVCCIIPEWNMVIIRMGDDKNPPEGKHLVWNQFLNLVGQSI
jgi:CubicO group peptidase (beta-lactamase class C family)